MANEKFTEEELANVRKMETFLKQAFCVDGDCNYIENVTIESNLTRSYGQMFVLTDSKRGRFYVTISQS